MSAVELEATVSTLARLVEEGRAPGIFASVLTGDDCESITVGNVGAGASAGASELQFPIGCLKKTFLAVVAAKLSLDRVLDLDAPIGHYLAELNRTPKGRCIRVWHLLSNTAGYRGISKLPVLPNSAFEWERFVEYFNGAPQLFQPGTVFSYEHSASAIVDQIIRRVAGVSSGILIKELILSPIWRQRPTDRNFCTAEGHTFEPTTRDFVPAPDLGRFPSWWADLQVSNCLTLEELLRFFDRTSMCDDGPTTPLRDAIALMQRTVIEIPATADGLQARVIPRGYGLGVARYEGDIWGHDGSTIAHAIGIRVLPSKRIAVAVGINAKALHTRARVLDTLLTALGVGERSDGQEDKGEDDIDIVLLPGRYIGPIGFTFDVRIQGELVVLKNRSRTLHGLVRSDGQILSRSRKRKLGAAFVREKHSGEPYLMFGSIACKRVGEQARETVNPKRRQLPVSDLGDWSSAGEEA